MADDRNRLVAGAVALVCAVAVVTILAGGPGPVRAVAVFAGLLLAPGWAVCAWLRLGEASLAWSLALSTSVAVDCLVALALVMFRAWHPVGVTVGLLLLAGGSLAARAAVSRPQEVAL